MKRFAGRSPRPELFPGVLLTSFLSVIGITTAGDPAPHSTDAFKDGSGRSAPEVVTVAAQSFTMGAAPDEPGFRPSEVRHAVELSPFSIGILEITNKQFCEFLNEEGNDGVHGIHWVLVERTATCLIAEKDGKFAPIAGAEEKPVVAVSWQAARAYCQWLSRKTGRVYRLPTEAEWECAARAGTTTTWWWGSEWDRTRLHAEGNQLMPVGTSAPNPWGLYDTVGNAWEFVLDCTEEDFFQHAPLKDPVLFNDECWTPGIRGGSFRDGPEWCRPGHRINTWWWGEYDGVGFRVVREEVESARLKPRAPHRRRANEEEIIGPAKES